MDGLISRVKLNQYSNKEIERLSRLPEFQDLAEKYGNIRRATEEEIVRAFSRTPFHEVEKALGIEGEVNDMVPLAWR